MRDDDDDQSWNRDDTDTRASEAQPPNNREAEQAILGAIMYENEAFEYLPERLSAEHFFDPFHQRLFHAAQGLHRAGRLADSIVLVDTFAHDPAFEPMGGHGYLLDMIDHAPPARNVKDYADSVFDLAMRRRMIQLGKEVSERADKDRDTPALDQITDIERSLYDMATDKRTQGLGEFSIGLTKAVENVAAAYTRDGSLSGLSTGLIDLDQKLGGLHPSDLIVLAGRPSMGKTALATNIAFHVARRYAFEPQVDGTKKTTAGGVVAFFSLEMSEEQLSERILSEVTGISSDRMKKGEIDATEFARIYDAATEIQEAQLYIDATGGISIATIATRCRRLKRTVGLDLVVVDYLQLAEADPGMSTNDRVSAVTKGLKALAKELSVPVIALSQVSRKCEERGDKRPQLVDLRDSGSIEQDADVVLFVFREDYYLSRAEPKEGSAAHLTWEDDLEKARGTAEVILGKQRRGPIGKVRLAFDSERTKFGNLAREGAFSGRD